MKNKQNDKEWELGGAGGDKVTRTIFCDKIRAKSGKQQKKEQSHKNEWEMKNKNKTHVEGMRNEEKKIYNNGSLSQILIGHKLI